MIYYAAKTAHFLWFKFFPVVASGIIIAYAAIVAAGCSTCGDGAVCGSNNTVGGPSALPSPGASPTPAVQVTPDPCRVEAVRLNFKARPLPFITLGAVEQLDVTPLNSSGLVPDGCNIVREPFMDVKTPQICQVIGGGFNPFVRGLKVGSCTITASVLNVTSVPFSVDVR